MSDKHRFADRAELNVHGAVVGRISLNNIVLGALRSTFVSY
jgi:hypothetical protein